MDDQELGSEPAKTPTQQEDSSGVRHSLSDRAVAADVQVLAALGNDTRYEALRLIAESDDGLYVYELEPLGICQGGVSRALSKLSTAGLVERQKEGRRRRYTATPRANQLLRILDETRALDNEA